MIKLKVIKNMIRFSHLFIFYFYFLVFNLGLATQAPNQRVSILILNLWASNIYDFKSYFKTLVVLVDYKYLKIFS